jgi:hypothetical protein
MNLKRIFILIFCLVLVQNTLSFSEVLRYHTVVLDGQNKILPWYTPNANAYDRYLYQLWQWLPTAPNYAGLPMYYLSCGFEPGNPIGPNNWENDWGERLPNWVEFGRLYYAYAGDMGPLNIAKKLVDYSLDHATTPSNFEWPNFPIGTGEGGAAEIQGKNVAWEQWDVLVDLASDMGMSFYKMYLIYGDARYRTAAINTADVLASKIQPGDAINSPWPYVVNAQTGATQSRYCSNWAGALTLFDLLIDHGEPNAAAYTAARTTLKNWILAYPMVNGKWVDGHSDNYINDDTNLSNTSKSNMNLYLLDNPTFDPNFAADVPALLQWTETNMVAVSTGDGLYGSTGVYYGAHVPAEQTAYMWRMGYQASRQAAEYARWYAISGNTTHKDIAYRGFNYSTYMMKSTGESSDGPSDGVGYWWSDCYGEGPRMFFHGFAGVPEWAPPAENHILYSKTVLGNVSYASGNVQYTPTDGAGIEYLRLAFLPTAVTVNGVMLSLRMDLDAEGYTVRDLGNGDYAVNIRRMRTGDVVVLASNVPTTFTITAIAGADGTIRADATFSITPNSGYAIADIKIDGESVGPITSYIFTNVTTNHTIAATFSPISTNSPPTIATAAAASPNPVTGTTTSLSVLGADDAGEANLTYTWATTGTPPAAVTFSANGTNGAKSTTATFIKAGSYSLQVVIKDQGNLTVTGSASVNVNQTLTSITVSPASASVNVGTTQQFTASASDQFSTALSTQPSFSWTVNGGGTISASGLFTAGSTAGGPYTVTASSGGKSRTANVTVTTGGGVLGNNIIGTSTDPSGGNDLNCWRFQAGSSFTANNIQINLATGITGKMKVAIYSDNNGSPSSLLVGSNEITNPSSGWVTFTLTKGQPITSGTYYWLAVWSNVQYTPRAQATGGTARYITNTYGAWPNPLTGTKGPYTNKDSIFAY